MRPTLSKRTFIKSATLSAVGFPMVAPRWVLGGPEAPSNRLQIAGIGIGVQGSAVLSRMETENIVALCDVDHAVAAKTFDRYPQAKRYTDYRELLEKEKNLDAVVIGTPDHTHAVISIAAMQTGKHVYCEKPLTHDIYEARRVAQVAKESGVVTQMGIQGHSNEGPRLICEWVAAGVLGEVREVDAWCSLTYYPPGHAWWSPQWMRLPEGSMPAPAGLDWDLWIGPRQMRPYHRAYHPSTWRAWWEFGSGMMGDRGAHTLDSVMWSLQLGMPEIISATCVDNNPDTHPRSAVVTFHFAARPGFPPLKLNWHEGQMPPRPDDLEEGRSMGDNEGGIVFKGSKATLMTDYRAASPRLIPETKMEAFLPNRPPKTLPRVQGNHFSNWIRACKGEEKAGADFDYGARLTEICLLGNLAKKFEGNELEWDAAAMRVKNLDEANEWVRRPCREGWSI